MKAGMDGYLVKPINREKLSTVIDRWIARVPSAAPRDTTGTAEEGALQADSIGIEMNPKPTPARITSEKREILRPLDEYAQIGMEPRSSRSVSKPMSRSKDSNTSFKLNSPSVSMQVSRNRGSNEKSRSNSKKRPLNRAVMRMNPTKADTIRKTKQKIDEKISNTAGKINILYVDDNAVNRKVIKRMAAKIGYDCDLAEDGKKGVAAFKNGFHKLVLMDCHMPVMDGFEAARRIGAICQHKTPIVALTAMKFDECRESLVEVGMVDYLSKPVSERKLKSILDRNIKSD